MRRATTIARRELTSYFFSPIAYVAMAVFLVACGFTFWDDFQPGEIAGMRNLFNWMVWLLVSIVPLLSMGLLAQEWATGTIETLMTAPVGEADVVLGKFLGSFAFVLFLVAGSKKQLVPRGIQNIAESSVDFVRNSIIMQTIGPDGLGYLPLLATMSAQRRPLRRPSKYTSHSTEINRMPLLS